MEKEIRMVIKQDLDAPADKNNEGLCGGADFKDLDAPGDKNNAALCGGYNFYSFL